MSLIQKGGLYEDKDGFARTAKGGNRDYWIDRIGKLPGPCSRLHSSHLGCRARRHGSGGAGSDGYRYTHPERTGADGLEQLELRLLNPRGSGTELWTHDGQAGI